jgi:ribosomal protein L29
VEILRGMSMADLRDFIKKLKAQLFELKMQHRATIYVVGNRVI